MMMRSFPIEWYKERLVNVRRTLADEEAKITRLASIAEMREYVDFMQLQIDEAVRQGKGSFDPDRFLKNKQPKK